jgi:uncharacterized membrane protein YhiD involved in acid resistance
MSKTFKVLLLASVIGVVVLMIAEIRRKMNESRKSCSGKSVSKNALLRCHQKCRKKKLAQREKIKKEAAEKVEKEAKKAEEEKQGVQLHCLVQKRSRRQ